MICIRCGELEAVDGAELCESCRVYETGGIPVRVCSHMRSGTHLLMATLWKNFEFPDLSGKTKPQEGKQFIINDEPHTVTPWLKLFSSHKEVERLKHPKDSVVYIVRHPKHTLRSLFRFTAPAEASYSDWLKPSRIQGWYEHALGYTSKCYWVSYEDLLERPSCVLCSIAAAFGLRLRHPSRQIPDNQTTWTWPELTVVQGKVGWVRTTQEPSIEIDAEEELTRLRSVIPEGFLGYQF